MTGVLIALAEHAFDHLFIECLGWDRMRASMTTTCQDTSLKFTVIAHKRGFTVLHCSTHRTILANRPLLREMQRQVRRSYHEHILIYSCEIPRKQVWQWVIEQAGHRLRQREHPFFSNHPPQRLVERIEGLGIQLEEEERTTLTDVLQSVRTALMPDNELHLFARKPFFAAKSDQLAMAMKRGELGAFHTFVQFHMPLARKVSRVLIRWFDMEAEDAEQTTMIGLLEAAKRFDPDRGFQFSTYAGYWLYQVCRRYGLQYGLALHVPDHYFWSCYKLEFRETELLAAYGWYETRRRFTKTLVKACVTSDQWRHYQLARNFCCFSDLDPQQRANLIPRGRVNPKPFSEEEWLREKIANVLKSLHPRLADIIKRRYGIGHLEHSLQEVGDALGLTRERIRQLQQKAEEKLKCVIKKDGLLSDWFPAALGSASPKCREG